MANVPLKSLVKKPYMKSKVMYQSITVYKPITGYPASIGYTSNTSSNMRTIPFGL